LRTISALPSSPQNVLATVSALKSHRLDVRAVIATKAGVRLREPAEQDELAPPVAPRMRTRRVRGVEENQLTIF
jgi:hypothetical protein